jgi:hypothetical protein
MFREWIDRISRETRTQIGWIASQEQKPGIPLHIHAVLVAPQPLDIAIIRYAWSEIEGSTHLANIEASEYTPDAGGLCYVLKLDDDAYAVNQIVFSDNLPLFQRDVSPVTMRRGDARRLQRIRTMTNQEM